LAWVAKSPKRLHSSASDRSGVIKAYSTDLFVLPLPEGHRFPMEKYGQLRQIVSSWPDLQIVEPPAATDEELALAHQLTYVNDLSRGQLSEAAMREIGFPWSLAMVERSRRSTGATMAAARGALLGDGLGINLAGGTHHAYADRGQGFCCFNDAAVTARWVQQQGWAQRVVIIDLDVHQGNGTAAIFQDDPSVFTISVHGETNFPFQKERSDLDLGLPAGAEDDVYLEAVAQALAVAQRAGPFDLLIYLAGADPLVTDRLGQLSVSLQGLGQRDQMVFDWAKAQGLAVAVAMAGGYSRPIEQTVAAHVQTIGIGLKVFSAQ
jgi:acetoin utilization deacetylase AcuC-like enzyme